MSDKHHRRGLMERWVDSILDQTGTAHGLGKALRKVFPTQYSFMFGEIALYSFVVLFASGFYLTFFFNGSQATTIYEGSYAPLRGTEMSVAYESVLTLSTEVKAGLLIRQMHHWSAMIFVGAITLHMCRIFFTGAFRRPREVNWVIGLILFILALAGGFSGYSLPDDLLSGAGLRITNALILSIPLIGERLAWMLFGGEWPGTDIIARLYPMHVMLVPILILITLTIHLALVWHQKHTQFPGPGRTEDNVVGERVWPTFALKSIGLLFIVAATIAALATIFTINPIWLFGPYSAGEATSFAQPDWYVGFLEGSLRLMPPWETRIGRYTINNLVYAGMVTPLIMFGLAFGTPWIERHFSGDNESHNLLDRPRDAPTRTAAGAAFLTFVGVLLLGGGQDVIANILHTPVGHITAVLQFSLVLAPLIMFFGMRTWCRSLAAGEKHDRDSSITAEVIRTPSGGYTTVELDGAVSKPENQRRIEEAEKALVGEESGAS